MTQAPPTPPASSTSPPGGPASQATLEGTLERVAYRDADSHFTVGKLVVAGERGPVTIVGELVGIAEGTSSSATNASRLIRSASALPGSFASARSAAAIAARSACISRLASAITSISRACSTLSGGARRAIRSSSTTASAVRPCRRSSVARVTPRRNAVSKLSRVSSTGA